jgi:hypothetical protein
MGSAQLLPNHNMFVGWGNTDNFSEYAADGRQIFNGSFLGGINTYRAYRFQWHGQPATRPAMAVSPGPDGALKVYSAWNGATQVARWRVLGGASPKALSGLGLAGDSGFETGQWVHGEPRYFVVEGLDAQGHVLGRSPATPRPANVAVYGPDAFVSSSTGAGTLAVACFALHSQGCGVKATITSGKTVLASTSRQPFSANRGGLLRFSLTSAGKRMLASAHSHQLSVNIRAQDSSGHSANRQMKLIQYTVRGSGPSGTASTSPTIQLLGSTEFATSNGQGTILSVCYAAVRCSVRGSLSIGGTRIGTVPERDLGANEVGYVPFILTPQGRAMLAGSQGNQLGAEARLTNGSDVAAGQVTLVRYR